MNKKQNILKLFTQDVTYNYHLVSTTEPNGNLIYIIKNGSEVTTDTLEFSPLTIAEELVKNCSIVFEKFAPAIYFTSENNIEELKNKLNLNFSEDVKFSEFIEKIKSKYRILEVQDSLSFKNDPASYKKAKEEEHIDHQKELWEKYAKQLEENEKSRKDLISSYNNDITKLLKDYFDGIIEYEKRDFDFSKEFEKIANGLIDAESWIKVDEKPFKCKIHICSLETDRINVLLTNNIDSFTATLVFDDTTLKTTNIKKIENSSSEKTMKDYDILSQLYEIEKTSFDEWEYKNETERMYCIIDYLVPILKSEKEKKEKELVEKILNEENEENIQ